MHRSAVNFISGVEQLFLSIAGHRGLPLFASVWRVCAHTRRRKLMIRAERAGWTVSRAGCVSVQRSSFGQVLSQAEPANAVYMRNLTPQW